jgi:hypothetical protein
MTGTDWASLAAKLHDAGGADPELDAVIAEAFGAPAGSYTESIEDCRRLVALALPGWHLHIGFAASGVFVYANLSKGEASASAESPTVPLAILRALVAIAAGRACS